MATERVSLATIQEHYHTFCRFYSRLHSRRDRCGTAADFLGMWFGNATDVRCARLTGGAAGPLAGHADLTLRHLLGTVRPPPVGPSTKKSTKEDWRIHWKRAE